jgi:hypothetical protein
MQNRRERFRVIATRIEKCIIELDACDEGDAQEEARQLLSLGWPLVQVERPYRPHVNDSTLSDWICEAPVKL